MRVYHIKVQDDKTANTLAKSIRPKLGEGEECNVSLSHGSGDAVLVLVLNNDANPADLTDQPCKEIIPDAQSEQNPGNGVGEQGSEGSAAGGIVSGKATVKRGA